MLPFKSVFLPDLSKAVGIPYLPKKEIKSLSDLVLLSLISCTMRNEHHPIPIPISCHCL